jgi:3-dehydroquinate dehydratase-2
MAKILVLHGPNLNRLGSREPHYYGNKTLAQINDELITAGSRLGHNVSTFQSNAEFALIDQIHAAQDTGVNFLIINPAALTHTSIALRDALIGAKIPFIEIHMSNVDDREDFRQISYLSDIALGRIYGFGAYSYQLALTAATEFLQTMI